MKKFIPLFLILWAVSFFMPGAYLSGMQGGSFPFSGWQCAIRPLALLGFPKGEWFTWITAFVMSLPFILAGGIGLNLIFIYAVYLYYAQQRRDIFKKLSNLLVYWVPLEFIAAAALLVVFGRPDIGFFIWIFSMGYVVASWKIS